MFVPFSQLPSNARLWIYQASRDFSPGEAAAIENKAQEFAGQWAAHGVALQASAKVLHNAFLVLSINQEAHDASGCSIDSSVKFVRELEQEYGVQLLDRTQLAFLQDEKVLRVPLKQMRDAVASGMLTPDTLFFNTLITTKAELDANWPTPAKHTWAAKYFEKATAS